MTLTLLENEQAAFLSGKDGVCLFCYEEDGAGRRALSVIPALANTVTAHFGACDEVLSQASLAALNEKIAPYLAANGYANDRGNRDVFRVFVADNPDFIPKTDKKSTILLKSGDNYQNLTTIDLPALLARGGVAYGYIENGRILSLAVTHADVCEMTELTLETARAYRGRGFGRAVLAALARDLSARGVTVVYRTRENNIPSVRAARSCGFRTAGLYYRYLGRRV